MSISAPSKRKRGTCPLCGAPATPVHTPFCSQGCRDRDLLNWLGDAYRTPGPVADESAQEIANDGLDRP
ncbi:DNA gyrase inhibitor YacG [Sphingomonas sp. DBB INV C78]|uniref:DNA gyrase inhibitor YacG n=1 Tax=Sphingomonas sp. DBB INV C78 TaxID=3349434 RepID=UPI0036D3E8A5